MLDIGSYAKLSEAKKALRKRSGLKLSFSDIITDLIIKRLEFLRVEEELKAYLRTFVAKMSAVPEVEGVLLFGSLAKGSYNQYSDIDILLVVDGKRWEVFEKATSKGKILGEERGRLMELGLPSLISPIVLDENDLKEFRPFYFDFADFGVILFERNNVLSDFIYSIRRIKHKRQIVNNVEVVTW